MFYSGRAVRRVDVSSVWERIHLAGRALLAVLLLHPALALADECTVEVTSSGAVGHQFELRSYTFDELSEITGVVDVDVDDSGYTYDCRERCTGPWWNRQCTTECQNDDYSCPHDRYRFSDNILTVDNPWQSNRSQCRAVFTVEGQLKDCTPGTPDSGDISQLPLFLTQNAPPNVMYILDDSGSMHHDIVPGSEIKQFGSFYKHGTSYLYPRVNGIYGNGGDDPNVVPIVEDRDASENTGLSAFGRRVRSPQVNALYYNPGITYQPWVKADGSQYPDADPNCALHNPSREGAGENYCRDLTDYNDNQNGVTWVDCEENEEGSSGANRCYSTTANREFWPATYYWYDETVGVEGGTWGSNNFSKVEIRSGVSYSGHGRENRADCSGGSCSYDQEIQNFANWYTYYRSRILTARAGTGYAFATQGSDMRVGFGTINQGEHDVDGVRQEVIVNGVRTFAGDDRSGFYSSLYTRDIPNAGTPLRSALNEAGRYFSRSDNRGPWGEEPGSDVDEDHLVCRRNYTILMTDGYWDDGDNVSGGPGGNVDGSDGPSHQGLGQSYSYEAVSPFGDDESGTLADVAMYYWKNDLRDNLDNEIFVTKKNPAFWQHMVTFGVGFGVTGTVDPGTAFAAIDSGDTVNWPDPGDAEEHKVDDLLHAGVNSRGGFFSAANPARFASELSRVLDTIANESKSSASSIATNSTRLDSGTLVYQASFNSLEWTGRIVAYTLADDGSLDQVFWDSDQTGVPVHGSRSIFTFVGAPGSTTTQGEVFSTANWDSLSASQRTALRDGGSVDDGKDLLNWLRGDQRKEGTAFRSRAGILGDIVNSDPFFVGNSEDFGYRVLDGDEGTDYTAYLQSKASRSPMIYVGANDGMLHGFDAETGSETFAVVLSSLYGNFGNLADPDYEHHYFVDGSPRALDAYINDSWTSVLVGATGAGGRAVYAIDVGTPDSMSASDLLWEFTTADDADDKLGIAMSAPAIARVKAGDKWVAVFGNGYESGDTVKLFVVDLATGALIEAIDTEVSGTDNGLATPVPVDVDGDRITDYVYAGDLQGNLWKFDLTGNNSNQWSVAFSSAGDPAPLFVATDGDGNPQPITSRPTVGRHPDGGYMVYVGTGQYFKISDGLVADSPQLQDFYGIRDNGNTVARGDLLEQTIIFEGEGTLADSSTTEFDVRLVSANGGDNWPEYGWRLLLRSPNAGAEGERSVSRPVLRNGRIIFATTIPNENLCGYGGRSWLMELDAVTGGRVAEPVLDTNGDGSINEMDKILIDGNYYPISGIGSEEIIKTPGIIGAGDLEYKYTSGSSGSIGVVTETGDGDDELGRQSWRQLQ